jgi:hypothetical protein
MSSSAIVPTWPSPPSRISCIKDADARHAGTEQGPSQSGSRIWEGSRALAAAVDALSRAVLALLAGLRT